MEQWISERGCLLHHGGDPGPRRRPHTTLSGINKVYFTLFTADGKRLLVLNLLAMHGLDLLASLILIK